MQNVLGSVVRDNIVEKTNKAGEWECSLVVEHLCGRHEVQGPVQHTKKWKKKGKEGREERKQNGATGKAELLKGPLELEWVFQRCPESSKGTRSLCAPCTSKLMKEAFRGGGVPLVIFHLLDSENGLKDAFGYLYNGVCIFTPSPQDLMLH